MWPKPMMPYLRLLGQGVVRTVGSHLGRIPNCLEVRPPPPPRGQKPLPSLPIAPSNPPPPRGPPANGWWGGGATCTAPAHQPLGSANTETTSAEAPATRHNMRRAEQVTVWPRKETETRRNVTQGGLVGVQTQGVGNPVRPPQEPGGWVGHGICTEKDTHRLITAFGGTQ